VTDTTTFICQQRKHKSIKVPLNNLLVKYIQSFIP